MRMVDVRPFPGAMLAAILWRGAMAALDGGAASAADFVVNDTADVVDATPGGGAGRTAEGACTLRAAVQEADALGEPSTVALPAGTHALSIAGANEDAAASGDLTVTAPLTIVGGGADATTIDDLRAWRRSRRRSAWPVDRSRPARSPYGTARSPRSPARATSGSRIACCATTASASTSSAAHWISPAGGSNGTSTARRSISGRCAVAVQGQGIDARDPVAGMIRAGGETLSAKRSATRTWR